MDVIPSIVRRLENRRPDMANQIGGTQMSSHNQELSNHQSGVGY